MKKSISENVLIEVGNLIQPFETFNTKEGIADFLNEVGFSIDASQITADLTPLANAVKEIKVVLGELDEIKEQKKFKDKLKLLYEKLKPTIKEVNRGLKKLQKSVKEIADLTSESKELAKQLPKRVIDYLIYQYLGEFHPKVAAVFSLNGINELVKDDRDFEVKSIHWSRVPTMLTKPHENFDEVYDWENKFNGALFLEKLENILSAYLLPGGIYSQAENILTFLGRHRGDTDEIRIPIFQNGVYPDTYTEFTFNISSLPPILEKIEADEPVNTSETDSPPDEEQEDFLDYNNYDESKYKLIKRPGLFIYPTAIGVLQQEEQLSDTWKLVVKGDLNLGAGFGLEFRPDDQVKVQTALFSDQVDEVADGNFALSLTKAAPNDQLTAWIGSEKEQGTFLGYKDYGLTFNIGNSKGQYFIQSEIGLNELTFKIDTKDGDGFIQKLLAGIQVESISNLAVGFSNQEGFYFAGAAGLDIHIPIHKTLGPIYLKSSFIGLHFFEGTDFRFGLSFNAKLGPIRAAVDKIGLSLPIDFPDNQEGNFGPIDVGDFKFIAPSGVGIELESGLITGGGFIKHYESEHTYSGLLSLNMRSIDLTAIGIIRTKMPNNKPGFSMLISISVLFKPVIQLSFGFTLNGVGGLVGINRTVSVDTLRKRIASGAVNSIMFPHDPINNAERIISDLRAVFPPREKHFVIAPFLKIGYGTPTMIEIDLGVVLEIPFKGRIILLGSVGVFLPSKAAPLVRIIIDAVGDFNFAKQYIRIDGRLRQSHILGIPLNGGFAFMLDWGSRPAFLFSIGGYHPRYKKPARFPEIPRLSALIRKGKAIILYCEYYQAITSNTFQIGFRADLEINYKAAKVNGHFGFNALIQFDPFYFDVDISMSVRVRVKGKNLAGVDLYFNLIGPAPWRVVGRAKIKILFFKLKIRFRKEWGRRQVESPTFISDQELLQKTKTALSILSNWTTKLPTNFRTAEILRPTSTLQKDGLVLHPGGYLEVRQTVIPLNKRIQKFGNAYAKSKPAFKIEEDININGKVVNRGTVQYLKEDFARAQYEEMPDAKKISTPDFEPMVAGISFGNAAIDDFDLGGATDFAVFDDSGFENIVLQPDLSLLKKETADQKLTHTVNTATKLRINKRSIRRQKAMVESKNCHCLVDTSPALQDKLKYRIATVIDLTPLSDDFLGRTNDFSTYSDATAYLESDWDKKEAIEYQIIYA